MIAGATFDAFEDYLERAVDRLDAASPTKALVRGHFAFDDASAKRGKRLRPRILVTVAEAEGVPAEDAFPAATAVELLHNFSLVHDDIQDQDEMRHGRPALWVRYGIPAALTAGDAMCALSYTALLDSPDHVDAERAVVMTACLHRALYALCAGQGGDIGFETSPAVTFDEYLAMIDGKTAALFAASCELGALAAGASAQRARRIRPNGASIRSGVPGARRHPRHVGDTGRNGQTGGRGHPPPQVVVPGRVGNGRPTVRRPGHGGPSVRIDRASSTMRPQTQ